MLDGIRFWRLFQPLLRDEQVARCVKMSEDPFRQTAAQLPVANADLPPPFFDLPDVHLHNTDHALKGTATRRGRRESTASRG